MQLDGITPPTHFNPATHVVSDDAKFLHYIIPSSLKSTQMYLSIAPQPKHNYPTSVKYVCFFVFQA
jgi:hypothetical protein